MEHIVTQDGSNTLFSTQFSQHYHSTKEGALNESLSKHVIPALEYHYEKKELHILDICFGLGYNTLATLYYIEKHSLDIKVYIYSPEFDKELLESLQYFEYPTEFDFLQPIIHTLSQNLFYEDDRRKIELFHGDARVYIPTLQNIDIVYQDAFSSDVNHQLWTVEYFEDIFKICSNDAIITTYSIATPIRLSLYKSGFLLYEYKPKNSNKISIALKQKEIDMRYKYIDMELKQQRNTTAQALYD